MLFVHLCSRLIRAFSTRSVPCQVQVIQRFICNVRRRGYVVSVVHPQSRLIHYENNVNNNKKLPPNNSHYYQDKRQNIRRVNKLLSHVEFLKIDIKDARVNHTILLEALELFSALDRNVEDSTSLFLLSCCGELLPDVQPKERQKLAQNLWDSLKEKGYFFSLDYYHTFLNVCAQNYQDINPWKFINSMTLAPNKETYVCLLNVSANTGNLENVIFILKELKVAQYSLSSDVINLLIKFYFKINDISSAKFALNNVIDSQMEVPTELFGSLACGYAQHGDIDNIVELLKQHSLPSKQLIQIIKNLCLADKGQAIATIFPYISMKDVLADPFFINTIIELTHLNKIDDCLLILNFFLTKGYVRDALQVSKYFLNTLASTKTPVPTILKISHLFSENFGFATVALALLHGALMSSRTELSLMLLESMAKKNVEIRPHYYWPLLVQMVMQKGELGVCDIINHSVDMNVKLDWTTLHDYIIPHISHWDPLGTLKKLTNLGIHEHIVATPLVKYYLEHGQIPNASILCQKIYKLVDFNEILPVLVQAYKTDKNALHTIVDILLLPDKTKDYPGKFLIHAVNQRLFNNDTEAFEKLLTVYKTKNILISSFAENAIENYAFSSGLEKIKMLLNNANIISDEGKLPISNAERISGMVHPKHMNSEELECHLIELKSNGLNFRGVLRKLFMTYARNGNLEKLDQIKAEMENYGMKLTSGMKASMLELYARNGKAIKAYHCIMELKKDHQHWKLDASKVLVTATALLKQNEVEKALKLINEIEVSTFVMQRQCWKLLDAAAHLKKPQFVDLVLDSLVKRKLCSIDNTILGPLIRVHLLRNDLVSAVEAFKAINKQYSTTPLRQELISVLVKAMKNHSAEDPVGNIFGMLDDVLDIARRTHSQEQVDYDLMIVYARFDMLNQLKLILQGLQWKTINFQRIMGAMEEKVKQKVLLTILNTSRGMNGINRPWICELLLASYSNTASIYDALELWEKMKDEDIPIPTSIQVKYLRTLEAYKKTILDKAITIEEKNK